MPAQIECAACTFSKLALSIENRNIFLLWTTLTETTCFPFYQQNILN